ncbi:MAG: hypothetical protein KBT20_09475 [Bacteroidales bacterium]|nr:hypothetical protein [Candidatus Liminaster caballi]
MPYRRLPNTDLARIYALKKAVEMEGYREKGELILSYQTTQEAQQFLSKFERAQRKYQQCYNLHSNSSKTYRKELAMARIYVSHFIQVLNMTIMRGELKKEIKTAYGLNPDNYNNPDLSSEQAVQEWGEKIIKAEEERASRGGVPIYNPTIAKVKVHWGIFNEHYFNQRLLRSNAANALEEVTQMRPQADDIILDIWNQVEGYYADLPIEEKMNKCKPFGLIYYYRKSEKARMKADQIQNSIDF